MDLLREIRADGYPTDYLAARVRGRRAGLLAADRRVRTAGEAPAESDAAIWDALLAEFDWLRRQMNPSLRNVFAPVFTLFSIKTLVLCLRSMAAEQRDALERLLRHELLGTELRDALQRAPGTGTAVAIVAAAIAPSLGDARGAEQAYAESGLKGFESKLTRDYLQHVTSTRPHRAVRRFFAAFIDLRNLMTLYKHLRWQIDDPAAFVPGGTLDTGRLREASAQGDGEYLDSAVRRVTGEPAAPAAAGQVALESRLLASLTRMLRKAGRDGDDVDLVLDYVWCTYVHARNRALCLHAGGMDAEVLQPELVA